MTYSKFLPFNQASSYPQESIRHDSWARSGSEFTCIQNIELVSFPRHSSQPQNWKEKNRIYSKLKLESATLIARRVCRRLIEFLNLILLSLLQDKDFNFTVIIFFKDCLLSLKNWHHLISASLIQMVLLLSIRSIYKPLIKFDATIASSLKCVLNDINWRESYTNLYQCWDKKPQS